MSGLCRVCVRHLPFPAPTPSVHPLPSARPSPSALATAGPIYWALLTFPRSLGATAVAGMLLPAMVMGVQVAIYPWATELFPTEVLALCGRSALCSGAVAEGDGRALCTEGVCGLHREA